VIGITDLAAPHAHAFRQPGEWTDLNDSQEAFPNFGEVDDLTNFEQIQRGMSYLEDEWIYMHCGLGIPNRIHEMPDGTIKGPATDELFMCEYIREWKHLMKTDPNIGIRRSRSHGCTCEIRHDAALLYVTDEFYRELRLWG
jgi:hypothetical protein